MLFPRLPDTLRQVQLRPQRDQHLAIQQARQVLRPAGLPQHDLIQPAPHGRRAKIERRTRAAPVQRQRHRPVHRAAQVRQISDHDHPAPGPHVVARQHRRSAMQSLQLALEGNGGAAPTRSSYVQLVPVNAFDEHDDVPLAHRNKARRHTSSASDSATLQLLRRANQPHGQHHHRNGLVARRVLSRPGCCHALAVPRQRLDAGTCCRAESRAMAWRTLVR
jgi:hypothetical protein